MELNLQFGYGMMDHCRVFLQAWGSGTVILSPRDLNPKQIRKLAGEVLAIPNGTVLLDPQFYLPDADHERLTSHEYWPSSYVSGDFWSGGELRSLIGKLTKMNHELGCRAFVLPGLYGGQIDDDWLKRQSDTIDEAKGATTLPIYATVALAADVVRSDDDVHELLDAADEWAIDGVYLVCEHPRGEYLVSDPSWMANVLDLVAGLRLQGKQVIVGYCSHQMLIVGCAAATAMASGTWMNVRSFVPQKFRVPYDDEIKQRAVWYYCPRALSEYKLPWLDIAAKMGVLDLLTPPPELPGQYAAALFAGPQPSLARWTEQAAFRHYLECLRHQAINVVRPSFDETVATQEHVLDEAEKVLTSLRGVEVVGQLRDFHACVAVNRAALATLKNARGAVLKRKWQQLVGTVQGAGKAVPSGN